MPRQGDRRKEIRRAEEHHLHVARELTIEHARAVARSCEAGATLPPELAALVETVATLEAAERAMRDADR